MKQRKGCRILFTPKYCRFEKKIYILKITCLTCSEEQKTQSRGAGDNVSHGGGDTSCHILPGKTIKYDRDNAFFPSRLIRKKNKHKYYNFSAGRVCTLS